ncbi:MAG: hypothetical protein IJ733_01585 [Lachnospiraceae bacterium]|nr:hypothetical protein [Lachnospiraceae bacterium]
MRIGKLELGKLIKNPGIWFLFVSFLILNVLFISGELGGKEGKKEIREMYQAVRNGEGELREEYEEYKDSVDGLYDHLEMMEILKKKEEMAGYHPTGKYQNFIENNYKKLQERVEEIKEKGEDTGDFYPGRIFKFHSLFYGDVKRTLLLEMFVLMMLSILYLMDYERIQKTRDIVIPTQTGKGVMKIKAVVGLCYGFFLSMLLFLGTVLYFLYQVPFRGLWNVPVSSKVMAEPRIQMLYPFITFFRCTMMQYFFLSMLVTFLLVCIVAGLAVGFQLLIQNSYLTFLAEGLLFWGLEIFAWFHTESFLDVVLSVCNFTTLWITSGAWFMENDFSLSFAGNEFWCVGCQGALAVGVVLFGRWRYRRGEV